MDNEQMSEEIRKIIHTVAVSLEELKELQDIDFGIFYKDKHLSFVNLELLKKELEK